MARFAAFICVLALLAGCGGDDKKDVQDTVRDFVKAVNEHDADTYCDDLITQEFLEKTTFTKGDKAHEACKREFRNLTGLKLKLVSTGRAKVDGDNATVTAVLDRQGQQLKQVFRLKKEDGNWKLSGAG